MSDICVTVGHLIVWTETGNACACGEHPEFGTRTLAGIRLASMPWPPPSHGADYIILGDKTEAEEAIASLAERGVLTFPGAVGEGEPHEEPVAHDDAEALVAVLRDQVMPMLRERPLPRGAS